MKKQCKLNLKFFSACTVLAYSSKAIKTIQHGNTRDVDLLYILKCGYSHWLKNPLVADFQKLEEHTERSKTLCLSGI